MDVQQHSPLPTFSMLVLSNCSLRSAMTALWDWRVWSDATCLLSRSRLTSSRDVTSFSNRHTSSSRCCRSDCHCKHSAYILYPEKKRKKNFTMLSGIYISIFFHFFFQIQQTNSTHSCTPPPPPHLYTASDLPLHCFAVLCLT